MSEATARRYRLLLDITDELIFVVKQRDLFRTALQNAESMLWSIAERSKDEEMAAMARGGAETASAVQAQAWEDGSRGSSG